MANSPSSTGLWKQASAGIIVGITAVIYSLSYGALLFSGPLGPFVGFGVTIALITAVIGALFGLLGTQKTFISGPDSNTISVLASILMALGTMDIAFAHDPHLAVAVIVIATLLCAAIFYAVARANLSGLIRYIPFPVMAGFLASTGWLMTSGALNIIAQFPLSRVGVHAFISDPLRPQLGLGAMVAASLFSLTARMSSAVSIPLVLILATLVVHAGLANGLCAAEFCRSDAWLFPPVTEVQWLPPWSLDWEQIPLEVIVQNLPGMLVVCFVGLLTILLSMASLELDFRKEFDLNKVLKTHAVLAAISAAFGGFVGIISIGRTSLNQRSGGGAVSGVITAAICLTTLLGGGAFISYIPKAALGGLVLYLGLNMIKQWLWNQRHTVSMSELGQIAFILVLVANYGILVGFAAGMFISCTIFIVSLSRIPLAELATNLSALSSSVVRSGLESETLRLHGEKMLVYRLRGYVFFGSASKIEEVFSAMNLEDKDVIEGAVFDFTNVSGIDSSAISVFQRILRRYRAASTQFYFVYSSQNETSLRAIASNTNGTNSVHYFASMDHAIEAAEEQILANRNTDASRSLSIDFLDSKFAEEILHNYCEYRSIQQGELLCADRELSTALYFIVSGSFEVTTSTSSATKIRLAKLHQGSMVGELAFYCGQPRKGAITAVANSEVYILSRDSFDRMRVRQPELATMFDHMVINKISRDLDRTNRLVAAFR